MLRRTKWAEATLYVVACCLCAAALAGPRAGRQGKKQSGPSWSQPASGRIHGQPFHVDRAEINAAGILTIREGKEFFADRQFVIFLFTKKGERLDGHTFAVSSDQEPGSGTPHVHMSYSVPGKSLPKTKMFMDGYRMQLRFGSERGGKLPGVIFLEIPDFERSYVLGQFVATVK